MEEKISPLTILEYEKEVSFYTMNVLSKKSENVEINYELENAIKYIETRARFYSNIITSELLELQEDHISYFASLDQRLKRRDRIRSKIIQKMTVDNKTIKEAAKSIHDALRYTIVVDDNLYVDKVDEYLKKIESLGYRVVCFKNKWGNEFYQGINVSFVDEDGFQFEVQFHTPNGYAIKEGKLRDVYNIIRSTGVPLDLVKKCNAIRKYYQSQVKVPQNAIGYEYNGEAKRRG